MEQLSATKGRNVVIPRFVERYVVMYYTETDGWSCFHRTFVTPESAIEDFLRFYKSYKKEDYNYPKFYKVVEISLEIPFITNGE